MITLERIWTIATWNASLQTFFFLLIMCEFINMHKIRQQYAKQNIQVAALTM